MASHRAVVRLLDSRFALVVCHGESRRPVATRISATRFALTIAVCVLAGCGRYSDVREKQPVFNPLPAGRGPLRHAEQEITEGLAYESGRSLESVDEYLDAARIAEQQLNNDPENAEAKRDYNFAVGRIVEVIRDRKLTPWTEPVAVSGSHGDFVLGFKADPRPEWNPGRYEFTPADQFDLNGSYVTERTLRDGIGAPTVAIEREINEDARATFAPSRAFYSVTALVHFEGQRCVLWVEDPLAVETVTIDGNTYPLAADFTAPLAVLLDQADPEKHEFLRWLNPEKYAHTAAIERLQPYDPNKTIVLVIHGLMDSQATWTPMINKLRGDAAIRKHYQFWFYSYPSGYPYPYSAAILREELDALEKRYPARKPMVVIGHSMGGCISRLLITDSGDQLWMQIFGRPPDEVPLSPHIKELLVAELFFQHRPEIGRVIFIAAPLRGTDLATGWLGRIGASLIKAPRAFVEAAREMLTVTDVGEDELKLKRYPNSVDTLAPNSRFTKAISTIPITPGIPYHSIIGDRGKGDSPKSSDGVVPYWSSHMDGAESERIVASGHSAHQNPEAIAEVLRILKDLHALNHRS